MYTYCENDPIQYVDPTGHITDWELDWFMGRQGDPSEYKNGMRVKTSSNSSAGSTVTLSEVADATTWSEGSKKATFSYNGTQQDLYIDKGKAYDSWGNVRGTVENGHIVVTNKDFNSMFGNSTGEISEKTTLDVKQGDHVTSGTTYQGSNVTINNYGIMDTMTTGKNSSLTLNNYGTVKNEVRLGENATAVIVNNKGAYINNVRGGDITDGTEKGITLYNSGEVHALFTGAFSTNYVDTSLGKMEYLITGFGNATTKNGNAKYEGGKGTIIDAELVKYLGDIKFDLKGSGDTYRVKLSSALIVAQWYILTKGSELGISTSGFKINGNLNDGATKAALKILIAKGIKASDILKEAKEDWEPEKPTLGTDRYSPNNGHLETKDMVYIPSKENKRGKFAIAENNTAVAWAMMVQGAIEYNNKGYYSEKEIKDYGKSLNISNFIVTGPDSGYRSYHMQVEAAIDWARRGKPKNASPLSFKYQSGQSEFNKLVNKLGKLPVDISGGWDNIDDSLTDKGGKLYGSGTSNHGLGAAFDLNFGMGQYQAIGITNKNGPTYKTRHWAEDYGRDYGFEGLYNDKTHYYKEWIDAKGILRNNFLETWHLNYMGPDVAPRK